MPGLPISLIVDDPAPIINPLYYFRLQVNGTAEPRQQSGEPMPATFPLALLERFAEVTERYGVRGKFSVLPYPAGLGSLVDGWDGADRRELAAWLQKVRERIVPRFDITPEILTHTRALDLATGQLLPESEHDWSRRQDEPTLTGYIAAALGILQRVGLDANGVTSPCDFGRGNEDAYARAVLAAQRQVCKRQSTWYFLHTDTEPAGKTTQVYCRDGDAWVVSVVSKAGDYLWQSMETQDTGEAFVQAMADKHLSAEGATGQFALLRAANQPIVFHTHWQSLYANGRYSGLRALELVCARIERAWRGNVAWTRCSDLAAAVAGQERQT